MKKMDEGYDVVIASRALPGSNVEVRQPWYRENSGRLFNLCVRVLALPGLQDTQCGFKLFSAEAAEKAFGPARLDGFSFDVEALFIARRRGFRIAEVPVTWRNDEATRVDTFKGAVAFVDLARIRWNDWRGRYDAPPRAAAAARSCSGSPPPAAAPSPSPRSGATGLPRPGGRGSRAPRPRTTPPSPRPSAS